MILSRRRSDSEHTLRVRPRKEPYLIINIIFAGVILLIFAYSGFFSPDKDNYPITCIHETLTGEQCVSCGISHSFSLIVRGRIVEAYQWNLNGMRVFIFFAAQLALRVAFSIFYLKYPDTRKQLIVIDCIGSGIIFLVAFWPFISSITRSILA